MTYPTHRMTWIAYIAQTLQRFVNIDKTDSLRAQEILDSLCAYVRREAPSGSGLDQGTFLDHDSAPDRVVLTTLFHHMTEHGVYDIWTNHTIVVTPEFTGISVVVKGRNKNDIKEYLGQLFHSWLTSEADHPALIEFARPA